jgi:hypothetical protein
MVDDQMLLTGSTVGSPKGGLKTQNSTTNSHHPNLELISTVIQVPKEEKQLFNAFVSHNYGNLTTTNENSVYRNVESFPSRKLL